MFEITERRSMALFGAYLSMVAYMNEEAQRKLISRHTTNYDLIQDNHKSLQYFILKDHTHKQTYIAIRGTDTDSIKESIRDLRVSLKITSTKINGYKVHRGYAKAGDNIIRKLLPHINHESYDITFVGHSLGGVLAKYCGIVSGRACTVLTYGAPKLAERGFYSLSSNVDMTCYINIDDIIPQFPPNYEDSKVRNYYIMDDGKKHYRLGQIKAVILPFLSLAKNTLFGNVFVGLKAHSIKNYVRHLTKLSKLK